MVVTLNAADSADSSSVPVTALLLLSSTSRSRLQDSLQSLSPSSSIESDDPQKNTSDDRSPTASANTSEERSPTASANGSKCKKLYEDNGNSKKLLLVMAIGAVKGNDNFVDMNEDPYKSAKNRKIFLPTADLVKKEISRRAELFKMKEPRPNQWKVGKCREWLTQHPLVDKADVKFLVAEEKLFRDSLDGAIKERDEQADLHKQAESWIGPNPYLRLYQVLIEDDIRVEYTKTHEVLNRAELDGRNSAQRPPNFYEKASKLYNSPGFNPTTSIYPDLHSDFKDEIYLPYIDAPTPVTPDKIKEKLGNLRAKLLQVITKWERSGNGCGQRQESDATFGHVDEETLIDDDRQNFLGKEKPHLLYFWQILDDYQILSKTLSILPNDMSASSEGIPMTNVSSTNNKRKAVDEKTLLEQNGKFQRNMTMTTLKMAEASNDQVCQGLRKEKRVA
jgi:hypothetical protein